MPISTPTLLDFSAVCAIITSGSPSLSLLFLCSLPLSLPPSLPPPPSASTAYSVLLSQSTVLSVFLLNHHVCFCEDTEAVATTFSLHLITSDRLLGYGLRNELENHHTLVRLELSLNCYQHMILPIFLTLALSNWSMY